MEEDNKGKPLYDARAEYSKSLVNTLKKADDAISVGDYDLAFIMLTTYFHKTHKQMSEDEQKAITKIINHTTDLKQNREDFNMDSDDVIMQGINKLYPLLTQYTSHLLIPTTESDNDYDEDDL